MRSQSVSRSALVTGIAAATTVIGGMAITVKFTGVETDKGGGTTDFCLDDTALND